MDHSSLPLPIFEIPSVIQKAALFGGMIAQPTPTSKIVSLIRKIDVDTFGTMFITLSEDTPLEEGRPVTVSLNYRDTTFQIDSSNYKLEGTTIVASLPREAKAIKLRDSERHVFPLNAGINGGFQRIEKRGGVCHFEARLIDISLKGLGIMIRNPEEEDLLLKNDHLWIKSLHGHKLPTPIFAWVVYTYDKRYKNGLDLRAGLSLETDVPGEILSELRELCRLVMRG